MKVRWFNSWLFLLCEAKWRSYKRQQFEVLAEKHKLLVEHEQLANSIGYKKLDILDKLIQTKIDIIEAIWK